MTLIHERPTQYGNRTCQTFSDVYDLRFALNYIQSLYPFAYFEGRMRVNTIITHNIIIYQNIFI